MKPLFLRLLLANMNNTKQEMQFSSSLLQEKKRTMKQFSWFKGFFSLRKHFEEVNVLSFQMRNSCSFLKRDFWLFRMALRIYKIWTKVLDKTSVAILMSKFFP